VPSVLDTHYLWHALEAARPVLEANATGSTFPQVNRRNIESLKIALPSLPDQRRIAVLLDGSSGIQRQRRRGALLLDQVERSVFSAMFGPLDPKCQRFHIGKIGDLVLDAQYGTAARANADGIGLPVLRMNNITSNGRIDLAELKWCDIPVSDLPNYTVRRGDFLFNRTNSPELVGKTTVWDRDDRYAFAGYLIRVRFDESTALPDYVSGYLNSAYGKRLLFEKAKASNNMSNISASELKRLPIPVPPLPDQKRYVRFLARLATMRSRMDASAEAANSLFASLANTVFRE
jgi:type I restriction enzyme S subunit